MIAKLITIFLFTFSNSLNLPKIEIPSQVVNPLINNYNPIQRISDIEFNKKRVGEILVEKITNSLPEFDQISHIVLDTNSKVVSYILHLENLPDPIKKNFVLFSIKLAQEGDNMGSHILQLYYDIVNNLM
jgi:hypothetical protein